MGVRGLTTYIERNNNKYLKDYKLRDTHLVIDGNSLCAQLYKFHAKCNDEFGGDYDKFAKCIETFFSMLKQCNVTPIVILDGGYEQKKIRTVNSRLRNKLKLISNINPAFSNGATIFPLFHREVFKDVVIKLNISLLRCDFEADLEIACIAKKLKCPVLSYDSDFFIYDARYIPFNTMDYYTTKINDGNGSNHYICCKIYSIEVFLKKSNIDKTLLPLMGTLLGNDYIKKRMFKKFYNHLKLPKTNGCRSPQHRTIIALIKWLEHETFESAVQKVLGRLKKHQRHKLAQEIKTVSQGYICTYTELFEYLGLTKENDDTEEKIIEIDPDNVESEDEDEENSHESESLTSAEDSEEIEDIDLTVELTDENEGIIYTPWFKNNTRNGNFPSLFIDILSLNMGIYLPQIEDTSNIESYNIFIPLLKAISKVLLQDKSNSFFYLGRTEYSRVKRYKYKVSHLNLPKISDIENLDNKQCEINFMNSVNFLEHDFIKICQFPDQWQLYLLAVVYWIKNAVYPKINYCHLSSIVLCLLQLSIVDEKVPNIREKNYFIKKFDKKLKAILETRKQTKTLESKTNEDDDTAKNVDENTLINAVTDVSTDDCLFFIDALVPNFKMNEKVKSNKNLFSIHVVDAFAQFQSCLLHISYLNVLFKFSLPASDISTLFNGTYIYNIYSNLEKRNDIDAYIELILHNSPTILNIYKQIISMLKELVELNPITKTNKKRKKKKNKTTSEQDEEINKNRLSESDKDNDTIFDHNNKFSILALTE